MSASNVSGDSFGEAIDLACDRFEAEWRAGARPQIEPYLAELPEQARAGLACELLKLEIHYRRDRGDHIIPSDYTSRFPDHASLIETLLGPALLPEEQAGNMQAGRYRLGQFIGEGGMADVFRALDPDFKRSLAVKVLKEKYKSRLDFVERFVGEARITGQLQHPGIPPVHEIGRLADGRPFLAMKLIEGSTLADLLAQRKNPADGLLRFLAIFEQISQTVAYAHSRRVIHRDLKPANVMVGAFGEVQVMDWGLAKTLTSEARRPAESSYGINDALSPLQLDTVTGPTQPGAVMGTLAYMPPEQARGEGDKLDERSDVFGLGATLCEILTGEPPYHAPSPEKRWEQAKTADSADAFVRLDACGADVELRELVKKCLASEMGLRADNAGEVAKAIAAYQAEVQDRLRKAEGERAAAEVKAREGRKRLRISVALAASLLALALLAGGATWWYQHEQFARETQRAIRKAQTEAVVPAAISEFQTRLKEAKEPTNDPKLRLARVRSALSAVKRAEEQLAAGEGSEELAEQVRQARAIVEEELQEGELLAELDSIRSEQAAVINTHGNFDDASVNPRYAGAMRTYGVDLSAPERAAARVRASRQREVLLAALEDWARNTTDDERQQLEAVLRAAEPAPNPFLARWLAARRDGAALAALARDTAALDLPATAIDLLAKDLLVTGELEAVAHLLRGGQERYPNDFWLNEHLGMVLTELRPSDDEGAVRFLTAALALRSDSPGALLNLGRALGMKKDSEGAIRCFRKATELDPKYANAHYSLGNALKAKGDLEEAIRCYRTALDLHPKDAKIHNNLGNALSDKGDLEEAIRCYRTALDLHPKDAMYHNSLGVALKAKGDPEGAICCFRAALDIDPKYGNAHYNLGVALYDEDDPEGAIRCYRTAIELDPKHIKAHINLGIALEDKGDLEEAICCFRATLDIDPKYAPTHYGLGNALHAKGDLEEAIRCYHTAVELDPMYAEAHCNLGQSMRDMGKFTDAVAAFKRGHELGSQRKVWKYPSAEWVSQCERLCELDRKLLDILKSDAQPAGTVERLELASLCQLPCRRLHAAAARFYSEAFAADPKTVEDPRTGHRYRAAQAATLAATGDSKDAVRLDDKERTRLRRLALDWLLSDLTAIGKLANQGGPQARQAAGQALRHWQKDADLAGIRDPDAVAKLAAGEQAACEKLWADVAALLKKVEEKK
jgi:serine/threonine-protein kinase